MPYEISTDHSRMQIDMIHAFLVDSYWFKDVRRDVIETAVRNSAVVGAFDADGAQVGFTRAVTDYATFAYICDVFVLEPHRGRGLCRSMMETLMQDDRFQTLRRWCLATWDAQEIYKKFGFEAVPADRWLHIKPAPSAWRTADS